MNPPGVVAAVNFAGGSGGDPANRPENPRRAVLIEKVYGSYGKTAKVPTLWLYGENDRYSGRAIPKRWFDEFVRSGGQGTVVQLPAYKDEGHPRFTSNSDAWKPGLRSF